MTYNNIISTLIIFILSLSLFSCGGGGGSSSSPPPSPPDPEPVSLSGAAIKGIIVGGIISAYEVDDSGEAASTPLATTTTDANGDYTLTLPTSFEGGPLILTLTADPSAPTTMKCDVANGCGSTAFGDSIVLPTDFELSAVQAESSAGDTVTISLTALTTLATAHARAQAGGLNQANIEMANSQVADTFGITGDINQFTPVDLTEPTDVADADPTAIKNALYSAGVLAALLEDGQDTATGLSELAASYAREDGRLIVNDTGFDSVAISLSEVLQGAQDIIDRIDEGDGTIASDLASALAEAKASVPGTYSDGSGSPNAGTTDLAKAKNFIEDIRTLNAATTLTELEAGVLAFEDQVAMAGELADADMSAVMEALGKALTGIALVADNIDISTLEPDFSQTFTEVEGQPLGVSVTISLAQTPSEAALTASVDEEIDGVAVNIQSELVASGNIEGIKNSEFGLGDSLTLNATGSASNANLQLSVNEGNLVVQADDEEELVGIEASLALAIAQLETEEVTNPISFEGNLSFSISDIQLIADGDVPEVIVDGPDGEYIEDFLPYPGYVRPESDAFSFELANLTLQGRIFDTEEQSFTATLALNLESDGFVAGELPIGFERRLFRYEVSSDKKTVDYFYDEPRSQLGSGWQIAWTRVMHSRIEYLSEEEFLATGIEMNEGLESAFGAYVSGPVLKLSEFDIEGNQLETNFLASSDQSVYVALDWFLIIYNNSSIQAADITNALEFVNLDIAESSNPRGYVISGEGQYFTNFPEEGLSADGGIVNGILVCNDLCDLDLFPPSVSSNPVFIGTDEIVDNRDNMLLGSISLRFSARLAGIEDVDVVVTASRTAFLEGDVSMSLSYGGRRFLINGTLDLEQGEGSEVQSLNIVSQDLIELIFERGGSEVTGTLKKVGSDTVLANLTQEDGIIMVRYNDDSFESLQ